MRVNVMKLIISVTILLNCFLIYSESFLSIHGYPQNRSEVEDYQIQVQTKAVLRPFIGDILYPVFGFPAMITENDREMSFIFRHDTEPEIEAVSITREIGGFSKEFTTVRPVSMEKTGHNLYRVKCEVPVILPSARYDLTVILKNHPFPLVSWNSLFFPEVTDDTVFYVWADPQIEDLQSKTAGKLNYNSGDYPYKSDSYLDFSRQEGIIKASVSQMNSGNSHFVAALGDLVFGINYQKEYEDIMSLMVNLELPFFSIPGNHDGYAKFTGQNDLTSPLEYDGLEYWTRFLGPLYYAFSFNDHAFLMLNTYDGTPQRRASGKPVGIGDNAAPPVSNWGGFQTKESLDWAEKMIDQYDILGIFGHMMPLGQGATGKYHKMKLFPKDSIIGVMDSQEWNIETTEYDSNPTDLIFNETQKSNTGLTLASYMTRQIPSPIYFSGHTHRDRIYLYEPGDELVAGSGVFATDEMKFIMTTTAATSGESYWGFRKVNIDTNRQTKYNYLCEEDVQCFPDSEENPGFQSIPAGNMWVTYKWTSIIGNEESIFIGGDNLTENIKAEIVNYLPTKEPVTLRFIMPALRKGYDIDNENFAVSQVGISKDLKSAIVVVKGEIETGSEFNQFVSANFTKTETAVELFPDDKEAPVPEVEYTQHILSNENISATVKNSEDYISLVWERNGADIFQGNSLDIFFDDYELQEKITLTYIAPNGAFGQKVLNISVEPYIEEPDEEPIEKPDETTEEYDEGNETEESIDEEEFQDEDIPHKKKKGCSVVLITF